MSLGKAGDNFFFDNADYTAADHRPPNRAQSADDGHEQDLNAGLKTEYAVGMNERGVAGEHAAGHAGEGGGDGVGLELVERKD